MLILRMILLVTFFFKGVVPEGLMSLYRMTETIVSNASIVD